MLKNAEYIYENVIISDENNTTKQYCKKAQVGVDLSVKNIWMLGNVGVVTKDKTYVPTYLKAAKETKYYENIGKEITGWFLPKGTYICELNEGAQFGDNDTGLIIMRSSLNRSGVTIQSAVWDPGFTTRDGEKVNTMNVRLTVDSNVGFFLEENSRVAQILIFENEASSLYQGQFQNGSTVSKLV